MSARLTFAPSRAMAPRATAVPAARRIVAARASHDDISYVMIKPDGVQVSITPIYSRRVVRRTIQRTQTKRFPSPSAAGRPLAHGRLDAFPRRSTGATRIK